METKFQVGQVWKTRGDELCKVTLIYDAEIDGTPIFYRVWTDGNASHTIDGFYYSKDNQSSHDLLQLVINADGTPAGYVPIGDTYEHLTPGLDFVAGELMASPDARTQFIENVVTMTLVRALDHDMTFKDVQQSCREAVSLRDELVK